LIKAIGEVEEEFSKKIFGVDVNMGWLRMIKLTGFAHNSF